MRAHCELVDHSQKSEVQLAQSAQSEKGSTISIIGAVSTVRRDRTMGSIPALFVAPYLQLLDI